jgi:hypothetical protein
MRTLRIALSALLVIAFAGALAGPASAARCSAKKTAHHRVKRCSSSKPAPKTVTNVTVDLLAGSHASVEVPSVPLPGGQRIIGTGVTEDVPLSGSLQGALVGKFKLLTDINVGLKSAAITLGAVDLLHDPACGGSPTLRINPASTVRLDPTRASTALLAKTGVTTATANVLLRLAFDSRTELGCDQPLFPTGYTDTPLAVKVQGKIGARGLLALALDSAATPVTVAVCLTPGDATKPCGASPAGYPVKITVHLQAAISLKTAA